MTLIKAINQTKKAKRNSLKFKVWTYFIFFSILILFFLWLFQIIFLNSFYKSEKTKDFNNASRKIVSLYNKSKKKKIISSKIDDLSRSNGICVEIHNNNNDVIYESSYNRGCLSRDTINKFNKEFLNTDKKEITYKTINKHFKNEVLLKVIEVEDNDILFLSMSLRPLDNVVSILRKQLIIITIVILLLSFLISYQISYKISEPIEKITKNAKEIQRGNYNSRFTIEEDINELNELVSALNQAKDELSKTEKLRRELLANISHDLKTPLTMIKAYAEMVRDLSFKDKEKRDADLNVIIEESDRLNLLVDDILELSKIQSNTKSFEFKRFNITEVIKEIVNKYSIYDDYVIKYSPKKDIYVYADENRIKQVIINLLNNAINYSEDDKTINIKIIDNDDSIRIEIKDSGIGISEEELEYIWKKYYKVDKLHKREKVGTGIGLSIVSNILEQHNSNYGVNSKIGKGTTFWFELKKDE